MTASASRELRVWAHFIARPTGVIARACAASDVDPSLPILAVLATVHGPHRLAERLAEIGARPLVVEKGVLKGVVPIGAEYLAGFATAHPERLVATNCTGIPAPRGADGERPRVWADLDAESALAPAS